MEAGSSNLPTPTSVHGARLLHRSGTAWRLVKKSSSHLSIRHNGCKIDLVLAGQWSPEDERIEVEALARQCAGAFLEVRLDGLCGYLASHAPLAIRQRTCGLAGDRWKIELDDGRILRLKLYSSHLVSAAALCSVTWVDEEGWRVVIRTTSGDHALLRAFHVAWVHARPATADRPC